jgi:hypothetical protein
MENFLAARAVNHLRNEEGSTKVVAGNGQLACAVKCNNCNFTFTTRVMKLVIENCKNCNLTVDCILTTGTLELINSENITLHLNLSAPTIQIDNCRQLEIVVRSRDCIRNIFSSKTAQFKITEVSEEGENSVSHEIEYTDGDWREDQFITRFKVPQQAPITEKVIREGGGYPTTQQELEINQEKDRRTEEALLRFVRSHVQVAPPPQTQGQEDPAPNQTDDPKPQDKSE